MASSDAGVLARAEAEGDRIVYNAAPFLHWSYRRDDYQTVEPRVQSRHEPGETLDVMKNSFDADTASSSRLKLARLKKQP